MPVVLTVLGFECALSLLWVWWGCWPSCAWSPFFRSGAWVLWGCRVLGLLDSGAPDLSAGAFTARAQRVRHTWRILGSRDWATWHVGSLRLVSRVGLSWYRRGSRGFRCRRLVCLAITVGVVVSSAAFWDQRVVRHHRVGVLVVSSVGCIVGRCFWRSVRVRCVSPPSAYPSASLPAFASTLAMALLGTLAVSALSGWCARPRNLADGHGGFRGGGADGC